MCVVSLCYRATTLHLPISREMPVILIFLFALFTHQEVLANKSVADTVEDSDPIMMIINVLKTNSVLKQSV
jgi:hypothetical protein